MKCVRGWLYDALVIMGCFMCVSLVLIVVTSINGDGVWFVWVGLMVVECCCGLFDLDAVCVLEKDFFDAVGNIDIFLYVYCLLYGGIVEEMNVL